MLELQHMFNYARALFTKARSEEGASAVEYGLLVAAIAAVIVIVVFLLGGLIKNAFNTTCGAISSGGTSGATCN